MNCPNPNQPGNDRVIALKLIVSEHVRPVTKYKFAADRKLIIGKLTVSVDFGDIVEAEVSNKTQNTMWLHESILKLMYISVPACSLGQTGMY